MLSQKSKIIILIVGVIIVLGIIVVTVFNLWPGNKKTTTESVDLSFLKKDNDLPAGQVFDASNRDQFAALVGENDKNNISPLEKQARDLARFFVERFGTYSSDAKSANIDDMLPFMTSDMRAWAQDFKNKIIEKEVYSATTTEVASIETISFSGADQQAKFTIIANRTNTSNNKTETYQQKAIIELVQNQKGEWQVDSLFWGDKL